MKYKLLISDEAYWDIADAVDYYRHLVYESLENKDRTQLKAGFYYSTENTEHYAIIYKGIMIYHLKSLPYQIHFLLDKENILVFRVFHGKSNPNAWEKRLTQ